MNASPKDKSSPLTRRKALKQAGKAVAGIVGVAASAPLSGWASNTTQVRPPARIPEIMPGHANAMKPADKLRIATCQFPVSDQPVENANYIKDFLRQAADAGAHLLHTSEASLSGYAGTDFPSFEHYDWDTLRKQTAALRQLAKDLNLWLVLGSAHFLDQQTKPTNCLYLISPDGGIADRYDKCFCTVRDQGHYSVGDRLVTRDIQGVRIGLAICFDVCWPQLYIAYRDRGATVMVHSFHNAHDEGKNSLDVSVRCQVPTRCSDNRMWAVCNNSSRPYSHWASFIARPDATIPKQLERHQAGMLIHDFPDGLSENGSYHNFKPMQKRDEEIMSWGTPIQHPRRINYQAQP